jgi:hypothetical protein
MIKKIREWLSCLKRANPPEEIKKPVKLKSKRKKLSSKK